MINLSPAIHLPIASECATIEVLPYSRYGRKTSDGTPCDVAQINTTIVLKQPLTKPEKFLVPDVGTSTKPVATLPDGTPITFDVIDAGALQNISAELHRQMEEFRKSPEAAEMTRLEELMEVFFSYSQIAATVEFPTGTRVITFNYTKEVPVINNQGKLETIVPLASFTAQGGSRMQCTVLLPFYPSVRSAQGVWKRPDGQQANLQVVRVQGQRYVLSAFWQNDPELTVTYQY